MYYGGGFGGGFTLSGVTEPILLAKVGQRGGKRTGREAGGVAHVLGEPARRSPALGPDCAQSWLEPQTTQKETGAWGGVGSHLPGVTALRPKPLGPGAPFTLMGMLQAIIVFPPGGVAG